MALIDVWSADDSDQHFEHALVRAIKLGWTRERGVSFADYVVDPSTGQTRAQAMFVAQITGPNLRPRLHLRRHRALRHGHLVPHQSESPVPARDPWLLLLRAGPASLRLH